MTAATGSSPVTAGSAGSVAPSASRAAPAAGAERPGSAVASDVAARVAAAPAGTTAVTTVDRQSSSRHGEHDRRRLGPHDLQRFTTTFAPARIDRQDPTAIRRVDQRCSSGSGTRRPTAATIRARTAPCVAAPTSPVPDLRRPRGPHRHDTIARRDIRLRLIGCEAHRQRRRHVEQPRGQQRQKKIVVAVGDLVEKVARGPGTPARDPAEHGDRQCARGDPVSSHRPDGSSTTSGAAGSNSSALREADQGGRPVVTEEHCRGTQVAVSHTCGMQSQQGHRDRSQQSHGLTRLELSAHRAVRRDHRAEAVRRPAGSTPHRRRGRATRRRAPLGHGPGPRHSRRAAAHPRSEAGTTLSARSLPWLPALAATCPRSGVRAGCQRARRAPRIAAPDSPPALAGPAHGARAAHPDRSSSRVNRSGWSVRRRELPVDTRAPRQSGRSRAVARASILNPWHASSTKPEKEPGRLKQMWQVFQMTRRYDSSIVWL